MNRTSKLINPITAFYSRLSMEDGRDNESMSITNQKARLKEYAEKNGMLNHAFYVDDGYTGRNYIESGSYIEIFFPRHGVRYIAIRDNVDSLNK